MLGKYVRVKVTHPIFSENAATHMEYKLNFGEIDFVTARRREKLYAFVLGINHPVETFDGRIIASFYKNGKPYYVVAPKTKRYIINDVGPALAFFQPEDLHYYFECSCGAVVYREIGGKIRYLVIKNKRSAHWSFPKGHVEPGETYEQTAKREVLEEAGIHIKIAPGFRESSKYMIQSRAEKIVMIFVAGTRDTNTVIQASEIDDYAWLTYEDAMKRLKFENDLKILADARNFLLERDYITESGLGSKGISAKRSGKKATYAGEDIVALKESTYS